MLDGLRVRGFPLLQLLIVAVIFAAAGIPVWSLTRPPVEVAVGSTPGAPLKTVEPAAAAATTSLSIETEFAPAPADFQIRCGDETVLQGHGPGRLFSTHWQTSLPKEGADLVVRAHWPTEPDATTGPAAAHIIVGLPDGTKLDKTYWTAPGQALAEIITVPGGAVPTGTAGTAP